jgi:hypothetical protein
MDTPNREAVPEVDMSEEAIDRRLRNVSQLFRLGMAIRVARSQYLGTVEELSNRDGADSRKASRLDGG